MPAPPVVERWIPWLVRLAWIAVLVTGGAALDGATADGPDAVGDVVRIAGFGAWVIGVAAMAIPAVVSLTATRVVVPVSILVAIGSLLTGADALDGSLFALSAAVATVLALSADFGRTFVQASAYGEEDRHILRPPAAYGAASILTWAVWASATVLAPPVLADQRWILGAITGVAAVGLAVFAWPRWHRLSNRWFVIVPIGVVVHDPLVLGETLMLRRRQLAAIRLAPADTDAADLTGPAAGHAIEITTNEPSTVHLAGTPKRPQGTVIHMTAGLIAPSRPGRALSAAAERRLPVG